MTIEKAGLDSSLLHSASARCVVDPPVLQAPMAGFTNYAYRQIVREFGGAGLLATEMIARPGLRLAGRARQRSIPTGCGACRTSRGRWPCRSGTTIRRRWPRSARGWPTSTA